MRVARSQICFCVVALCAVSCAPPPPAQPAPQNLTSPRSVTEVTQAASRSLVADGFEVTLSDAAGGIVTAKRTKARTGNSNFVTCRFAHGSIGETNMETTLTVTVTSTAAQPGARALISSNVRVAFPGLQGAMAMQPSDTDCASTGVAEKHVAAAVGASASP
jgi:hypothetical protein